MPTAWPRLAGGRGGRIEQYLCQDQPLERDYKTGQGLRSNWDLRLYKQGGTRDASLLCT